MERGGGGEGRQHHVLYTAPYNRKAKPWSNCGRFINEVNVDLLPNEIKGPTWSQTHRSDVPLAAKSASNRLQQTGWRRVEADFAERMRSGRKRTKNSRSTVSLFTGVGWGGFKSQFKSRLIRTFSYYYTVIIQLLLHNYYLCLHCSYFCVYFLFGLERNVTSSLSLDSNAILLTTQLNLNLNLTFNDWRTTSALPRFFWLCLLTRKNQHQAL